jgi:hypothetical protein
MTLFQRTLKTVANSHKCGDTFPQKSSFMVLLNKFYLKKKEFAAKYFIFRNCLTFRKNFKKKKKNLVGMEEKLTL